MRHATLSILFALLVNTPQFARADAFADAFLYRPEAPRFETEATGDVLPDDLTRANPYEVRPDYPAASRRENGSSMAGSQSERGGDPIYRGFPAHVIGAH